MPQGHPQRVAGSQHSRADEHLAGGECVWKGLQFEIRGDRVLAEVGEEVEGLGTIFTWDNYWLSVKQSIMPIICLAVAPLAMTARQMRSSVLEVNNMDYVRTAWSKGLKEKVVVFRHVLKNSLLPVVTMLGISIGLIFGGSVIIENLFAIPGVGRLLVGAVFGQDYVVIQGGTLVIATIIVIVNLIVDISYGWLDPRIRYE